MKRPTSLSALLGVARFAAGAALILTVAPMPASAQISRFGPTTPLISGGTLRGSSVAYDPAYQVYLVITDRAGSAGVTGVFVNTSGQPVTSVFTIYDGSLGTASFVNLIYSSDVNNGAGGSGGFLVAWNQYNGHLNNVAVRTVTYPNHVVSGVQMVSAGEQNGSYAEAVPAIAYSHTSHRFLVAWQTAGFGILGRFVDVNGTPFGASMLFENAGGARDPSLAWNPSTDQFGLLSSGFNSSSAFESFRRVRASDGLVFGRTTFGFTGGTFATAVQVNAANQYVGAWGVGPGTWTATFDSAGNKLATNFITSRLGFNQSLDMAYNPVSGTFLAVSSDTSSYEVGAVEVAGGGAPNSTVQIVTTGAIAPGGGSFYPRTTAQANAPRWNISYSRNFTQTTDQVVATTSTGGGTGGTGGGTTDGGGTVSGCTTPDPFAAIGGGTCVNGGWVPSTGGTTSGGTSGGTTSGGCMTTDPFAAIGGGTCVNGGWVPKTGTTSGGTTSTGGCTTADPFAAIGGGICVNGGWVPKTGTTSGGTTSTGGCTTPDPFVAIGGGHCVNGGWLPGASTSGGSTSGGCTTADPFASIGGGVCVNGGWVPKTSTCTTPDPFASIGGGVCVNGGWVPKTSTSTCTTPDPFASIGGGKCVNGGWVPIGYDDDDD